METFNGVKLKQLLDVAHEQGIAFEITLTSVQGLRGIYVMFESSVSFDNDTFNCALIECVED